MSDCLEMRSTRTYPHEADKLLITNGLVGLVDGGRALGMASIAEALIPTTVVFAAFVPELHLAVSGTAGPLVG